MHLESRRERPQQSSQHARVVLVPDQLAQLPQRQRVFFPRHGERGQRRKRA